MVKEKTEKKSKIWVILGILIPVIILAILAASLFLILDSEKAKEALSDVPVISSILPVSDDKSDDNDSQDTDDGANDVATQQKEEIEELEREIASIEEIVDDKDKEIKKLEKSLEDDDIDAADEEVVDEVKQTAGSFRKMDPEKAAGIIENMEKSTAIDILNELSGNVRGGILAEIESKKAAELTEGMMND